MLWNEVTLQLEANMIQQQPDLQTLRIMSLRRLSEKKVELQKRKLYVTNEVEYLGAWTGTFLVNKLGMEKSMIKQPAAMESEETCSETAYERDTQLVINLEVLGSKTSF
jgi:hypothetical protein